MDAMKISVELGWNPAHTLEKRLRDTVSWYLQHQGWVESIARD
jgi:dTDP-glucose 4,6-dehydratase